MIRSWLQSVGDLRIVGNPLSDRIMISGPHPPLLLLKLSDLDALIAVLQQARAGSVQAQNAERNAEEAPARL
jgi:hypothetical protein